MKFNYSFQQILDLKNSERTQAEWVLSDAIGRLRSEENRLSALFESRNELQSQIAAVSEGRTTISQMMLMQSYIEHIDLQIVKKVGDIEVAQGVVMKKQENLTEKMLDEKVWNKAREKAFHKYRALVEKKEQETLDEMATNRFRRSSQPG